MREELPLERLAAGFKALAEQNRLRILLCLEKGEKSVSQLVKELGLSQPLVSHHLKELRYLRLVSVRKEGPFIFYRLRKREIIPLIKKFAKYLASEA